MKEQIREIREIIMKPITPYNADSMDRRFHKIMNIFETLLQEQKQEIIEGERLRIKSRGGSLRQWLNELPNDFIVSNDVIEHWLEISEQLKQEKQ